MSSKTQKILLFPLALVYGTVIRIRNYLFDTGIIKSTYFRFPVISIGNLTVGGTGKTPHTEYLIRLLKDEYKIAVLSRGYKRKTKDFKIVEQLSDVSTAGDEPLQIKRKFKEIIVVVDRDRVNGVREIMKRFPDTDIVLLDDAFQHRYIDPGFSILLIDFNRLITDDLLLPAGRLREHRSSVKRANIVLITKSPPGLSAIDMRIIFKKLPLLQNQHLFYTSLTYDDPVPVFGDSKGGISMERLEKESSNILLITGIAEPEPLVKYLGKYNLNICHLKYQDHHAYSKADCKKIREKYLTLPENERCLITTEKDFIRLKGNITEEDFPDKRIYYIRINVRFLNDHEGEFNKFIMNYVKKNRRNGKIS